MKLTVKHKLYFLIALVNIVMIMLGLYASYNLKVVNSKSTEITSNWLPGVEKAQTIEALLMDIRIKEFRYIAASTPKEMTELEEIMVENEKLLEKTFNDYEKTIFDQTDRNLFIVARSELNNYLEAHHVVIGADKKKDFVSSMDFMKKESLSLYNCARESLAALSTYNRENADRISKENTELYNNSKKLLFVAIFFAILFNSAFAYFTTRSIVNPLQKMEAMAHRLAEGDLTTEAVVVTNQDEIGNLAVAFSKMKNNLHEAISHLNEIAQEISGSSMSLAIQAEQTSAAASENAATVEEIASTIDQVAQNSNQVSAISEGIATNAAQGTAGIARLNQQINRISDGSQKTSGVIGNLSSSLSRVTQIVDLITGIADQTNLLALNAAIEAARAGEQGRGFAVVAEEVRKLAEQSGSAAKEISKLILNVQEESKVAVQTMQDSNQEVQEGVRVAGDVGQILQGILSQIDGLSERIQEVAAAAQEVSAGVQNVASSTEEQTAAMLEVSNATDSLKKLSYTVNDLVSKFKI